ELTRYGDSPDLNLAHCTFSRAMTLEQADGSFGQLDSITSSGSAPRRSATDHVQHGSQTAVFRSIKTFLDLKGRGSPSRIYVTGAAGVGKSVLLRRLARDMAAALLIEPASRHPVPILMPLQQIGQSDLKPIVGSSGQDPSTWEFLVSYWCEW